MAVAPRRTSVPMLQPVELTLDRTTLVLRHRRLVYLVAWSHVACGLEIDDLIQEGMCGLLVAARRFDPGRGVKFWTYARFWVLEAIRHMVVEHSRLVHVPAYLVRMINQATTGLSAALGRPPTIIELADAVEIDPDICQRVLQALDRPLSLSAPAGREGAPLSEILPDGSAGNPETLVLDAAGGEELRQLLITLPARERMILRARFGMDGPPCTFEELARIHAISGTRVRQLYRAALARIRDTVYSRRPHDSNFGTVASASPLGDHRLHIEHAKRER